MKNILIFASLAGIAAAIAIYFVSESNKSTGDEIADAAGDAYNTMNRHMGQVERGTERGFNAMS